MQKSHSKIWIYTWYDFEALTNSVDGNLLGLNGGKKVRRLKWKVEIFIVIKKMCLTPPYIV